MKKEPSKRLSLDLTIQDHTDIKTRAAFKNLTMKLWIIEAIKKQIAEEKKYE